MENFKELYEYRQNLLAAWIRQPEDVLLALAYYPKVRWHQPLPGSEWSAHQWLAVLRTLEARLILPSLQRILDEDQPQLERFDPVDWLAAEYRPEQPLDHLLAAYAELRAREHHRVAEVRALLWNRSGRHPWFGVRTLQWWVEHSFAHSRRALRFLQSGAQPPTPVRPVNYSIF